MSRQILAKQQAGQWFRHTNIPVDPTLGAFGIGFDVIGCVDRPGCVNLVYNLRTGSLSGYNGTLISQLWEPSVITLLTEDEATSLIMHAQLVPDAYKERSE